MRYFGRHPRTVEPNIGDRSPSAVDGRFPRSSTSTLEYSTSSSHPTPYVPNSKQGASSSLSSSTHNSRSWGSSCSTEKQPYAQQECVPEEPEDTSSTVWNELDDLKSRIKRLEITGKVEPSPGQPAPREKDERPKTAATESSRYVMQSPKRSQSATDTAPSDPKSQLEGSVTPSNGGSSGIDVNQLHPLLHTSLSKAKLHLSSSVFRALQNTAQDALVLAALLGSTATGTSSTVAIPNGNNNNGLGLSSGTNDRQARRKADSVCRDLTELCLALSEEMVSIAQQNGQGEINGANGSGVTQTENMNNGAIAPVVAEYDRMPEHDRIGNAGANNMNGYGDFVSQMQPQNNYTGHNEGYYNTPEMGQSVQQPQQNYTPVQRMSSTASRREHRNSALLNLPPGYLNTNISPRNSLIIDPASNTSSQTQISGSDTSLTPVQFSGSQTTNKGPVNAAAAPVITASPSRLSRLSTVFKTRRLQQQIGIDIAPEHVIDDQVAQSPVPLSAVPGGNPRSRTTSRVSFANGPANQGHRLSSVTSGTRERRFSRDLQYEPDFQGQQQQQQPGQTMQGRSRPQAAGLPRGQVGPATPQFSFQSPLRSRTFTPQGSMQTPPQQQHQPAATAISTHVPLTNQTNMNIQPGFRRFGLSSMLGKKQGMSNGDGGLNGTNSPASPAVSSFNVPNTNEEMNPSNFQNNIGVRPRNTQPLNLRPRTRSVGNSTQAMAPQQDANSHMAYGSNQQTPNVSAMRRVSLRPRLRSTHSTEGL